MYDIELIDGQPQATRDIGKDESASVSPEAWEVMRNQRPPGIAVGGGQDFVVASE